jgi:hypothetical protein
LQLHHNDTTRLVGARLAVIRPKSDGFTGAPVYITGGGVTARQGHCAKEHTS